MDHKIITGCLVGMAVLLSCNSPLQNKKERAQHDSANAPPEVASSDNKKNVTKDTTYDGLHIIARTEGTDNIRNLVLIVVNKKDTTQQDSVMERDIKGTLKDVMIADLDKDGKPEIYCSTLSEGTGHYGKIYAYNLGNKITGINTDAIDTMELPSYRGEDTFYIKGDRLVRSFPAYKPDDPEALTSNTKGMLLYYPKRERDTLRMVQQP